MIKIFVLFYLMSMTGNLIESKMKINVAIRLANGICGLVQKTKDSNMVDPNGLKDSLAPPQSGECFIWEWTKCDYGSKPGCSEWAKKPCVDDGRDPDDNSTKTFCDIYQCGWTLDELHENWGYNPFLWQQAYVPDAPPRDELIDSGSTLDYPTGYKPDQSNAA